MGRSSNYMDQSRRAMKMGMIAERVIISLAKFQAGQDLDQKDFQILEKAREFLEGAKNGYSWTENPQISEESIKSAFSFDMAANVWALDPSPGDFISDIDSMMTAARAILEKRKPDPNSVAGFKGFFERIFRRSIDNFAHIADAHEVPDFV